AVSGRLVADAVPAPARALFAPTLADALDALLAEVRPGDLVLTAGAGDVTELGQELLAALQKVSDDERDRRDRAPTNGPVRPETAPPAGRAGTPAPPPPELRRRE